MFKIKHDTVNSCYKYLNINPFEHQIKILLRKSICKLINEEQPKTLRDKFPLKRGTAINSHNQNKFIVPFYITTVAISSLSYQGTKIWNNKIVKSVKNAPSSKYSVKRYQEHLCSLINPHV